MFAQAFYQQDVDPSQNSLNQDDDDEIKLFAEQFKVLDNHSPIPKDKGSKQLNKPMNDKINNMNSKKTLNEDLELDLNPKHVATEPEEAQRP